MDRVMRRRMAEWQVLFLDRRLAGWKSSFARKKRALHAKAQGSKFGESCVCVACGESFEDI